MKFAVVGGGITGLVAARTLSLAGHPTTLLEREARLGGKIRTERRDGFLIEAGPDSFIATKPAGLALCRELGLAGSLIGTKDPARVYVFARGALHALPDGVRVVPTRLWPITRSSLFTPAEKARIAADLVLPGGTAAADESLGSLIRRRMGRAALDRLVGPLASGIYAADPERLSVEATFPQLSAAVRDRGSLMRGLRTGRIPAPTFAASANPRSTFVSLAEGLGSLVDRVAEALRASGGGVRSSAAVAWLAWTDGGYRMGLEDGTTVEADGVILAVPAPDAARLLQPLAPTAAALLGGIACVSTVVVTLAYRAFELPELGGHGFVVARDQPAPITACTWTSSKWPGRAPEGRALLRVYLGSATHPVDLDAADEWLISSARQGLAAAMGVKSEPVLAVIDRWPGALPQYAVWHRERVATIRTELARYPRLTIAGAAYGGVGLADCIAQGAAAARKVVADHEGHRAASVRRGD